jgi:hypothetical protein
MFLFQEICKQKEKERLSMSIATSPSREFREESNEGRETKETFK